MEVLGKIKVINPTQQVTDSFKKRELVVTTDEQYPQHILIEFAQDKCELLNNFKVGDKVNVGINLRGREWVNPQGETKYFNQIQGWKIFKEGAESSNAPTANNQQFEPEPLAQDAENLDLPF
jgi:translation initiation factor IF-3